MRTLSRILWFNSIVAALALVMWFWRASLQPAEVVVQSQAAVLFVGPFSIAMRASSYEQVQSPSWKELGTWAVLVVTTAFILPGQGRAMSALVVAIVAPCWYVLQLRQMSMATGGVRNGQVSQRTWLGAPKWRVALPILAAATAWSLSVSGGTAAYYGVAASVAVWYFANVPPRPRAPAPS